MYSDSNHLKEEKRYVKLLINVTRSSNINRIKEKGGLTTIDISNNALQGALPILPPDLYALFASNNRLSGPMDSSICNSSTQSKLSALDLSNNMLVGQSPSCLGSSFYQLSMLNLRSNNLTGSMPVKFLKCSFLEDLDLSYNQLEGIIPRSLAQCNNLEVLNLGNNRLSDIFPGWLGTLPKLQVLVLRSDYFYGTMTTSIYSKQLFSKLQILDMSKNHFNGTLPSKLIQDMQAMRYVSESETKSQQYLVNDIVQGGYYSITIMVKGFDRRVERILNTLTTIDVSSNMFEGDIPTSVGDLEGLRWLNFSHNNFANQIPPTIGNIRVLESLDLSCNNLSGKIPQEIAKLTYLEVFNVSQNQLVGFIPHSTQLSTFNSDSYLGNPGLCGPPLSKKCRNEDTPQQLPPTLVTPPDTKGSSDLHLWQVILMGCAFGWVVGVISRYFTLAVREPLWLSRLVCQLEHQVLHRSKIRARQHQMKATRN
ncbi:hypothetical protein Cgig2_031691 [Carnegiea gigantea]|uniref:Uncharacterized protein n=1 Tax=Carnegiea gigantea TaxID=171969 RepID=A0A9Q1KQN8_9CARY|nr:hypothetical protein Cgig2_031691 [Carnegiea gigantea]